MQQLGSVPACAWFPADLAAARLRYAKVPNDINLCLEHLRLTQKFAAAEGNKSRDLAPTPALYLLSLCNCRACLGSPSPAGTTFQVVLNSKQVVEHFPQLSTRFLLICAWAPPASSILQ